MTMINPFTTTDHQTRLARRTFLARAGIGLGGFALATLLRPHLAPAAGPTTAPAAGRWRGVIHPLHRPVKAKRVIHLCMAGGPSHLESFDFKPELKALHGKPF